MNFLHSTLNLKPDQLVEVTLAGSAANVMLMDDTNYARYRDGHAHHYYGGYYTKSPVHVRAPFSGVWHVIVDLGHADTANVSASIAVVDGNAA